MEPKKILLLGEDLRSLADIPEFLGIKYILIEDLYVLEEKLSSGSINPDVAFIHLSYKCQKPGRHIDGFCSRAIEMLPETTRRVIGTWGIDHPEQAKNTAIILNGDILLDLEKFYSQCHQSWLNNENTQFHKIIERGCVTLDEINQRGKTIELRNGLREELSPPREREADPRFFNYGDSYFRRR